MFSPAQPAMAGPAWITNVRRGPHADNHPVRMFGIHDNGGEGGLCGERAERVIANAKVDQRNE
jgi:hypothetical protein